MRFAKCGYFRAPNEILSFPVLDIPVLQVVPETPTESAVSKAHIFNNMLPSQDRSTALVPVLRALRRYKVAAAIFFVVVLGAVGVTSVTTPKAYRSQTKLFLRLGRENSTLDPTATLGDSPVVSVPPSRENEINSVIEVLKSQVLLERVVDRVGARVILGREPWQPADPAAAPVPSPAPSRTIDDRYLAIELVRKVEVEAIKKSNIIQISFEGLSPEVSRAVVASLVEFYLIEHVRVNRTPGVHEFLADQTGRQRTELTRVEDALRTAKEETGLIAPDAQRQAVVERLGRVEAELAGVTVTMAATEAEITAVRGRAGSAAASVVTGTTKGLPNQAADAMRAQLFTLQVRELELLAKYPETHPELALVRKQTADAESLLAKEEAGREQVTTGPNPIRQDAELTLARQEASLAALKARHAALEGQLVRERELLKTLNRDQVRVGRLQRDVEVSESRYRRLVENLERSQLDRALEAEKISNVSVVQPATYDPRPVRPNTMMNLALGLVVAAGGAVGLAVLLELRQTASGPAHGAPDAPNALSEPAKDGGESGPGRQPGTEDLTL